MSEPIAMWHAEHRNFARLLDLLERELDVFHSGGRPGYELMSDIVHYLRRFGDTLHHPREDVAFARLVRQDPAMQMITNRLQQEHRVIARAGEDLASRLNDALEDIMIPRAAIEAAAATYLVYYRHHLAKEEREVIPRAAELLTADDWKAVGSTGPVGSDPLFGPKPEKCFRELLQRLMANGRAPQEN